MTDRVIQGSFVTRGANRQTPLVQPKPTAHRPPLASTTFAASVPVAQSNGADDRLPIDPARLGLASGGGRPLPDAVRGKMEAAFGTDFSGVRVHIGPQAERIGALAFTIGTDIYFAPGRYQPDSIHGQQLLGHELAHVVQQRQGRVRGPSGAGIAVVQDPTLEAEADRLGQRAATVQAKPAGPVLQGKAPMHFSAPLGMNPSGYPGGAATGPAQKQVAESNIRTLQAKGGKKLRRMAQPKVFPGPEITGASQPKFARPPVYRPHVAACQPKPAALPVYRPYAVTSQLTPAAPPVYRSQPVTSRRKPAPSPVCRPQAIGPIQRYRSFGGARGAAQFDYKIFNGVDQTYGRYHIKFHNIRGLGFFDEIHVVFEDLKGSNYFFYTDQGVPIIEKSSGLNRNNSGLTSRAQDIVNGQLATSATIANSVAQGALDELDRFEAEQREKGERLLKEKAEKEALERPSKIRTEVERLANSYALARQLKPSGILERLVESGVMYKLFEMDFGKLRSTSIESWPTKYRSLIKPGLNPTLEFDDEDDQYDVFYDFDES